MGEVFNIDEIFEIAEQIERNGAIFYRRAADMAKDSALRDLYSSLAAMEDEHESLFGAMRADTVSPQFREAGFDPDEQAAAYLRAMAAGHVFPHRADPAETLRGDESPAEVLKMAIQREKDAVAFYLGMKELTPAHLGREVIDSLVQEEMAHVAQLSEQLRRLEERA